MHAMRLCVLPLAPDEILVILREVPLMEHNFTVTFKGEDVGGDAIQEPAVMGDYQYTTREGEHGLLQCAQGFHIEIVGRFIQEQNIGVLFQGSGQMQPSTFAA
jgi:hypothetical protein